MKRMLMLVLGAAVLLGSAGCASQTAGKTDGKHLDIWRRDLFHLHREWDSWGWEDADRSDSSPYRDF